jgi:hypothetical protein
VPQDLNLDQIDLDPYARMLARAAEKHEIVLCDRASAVVLYAENRLTRGASDPYTGIGGILGCAGGRVVSECYADSNNRRSGFPMGQARPKAVQAMTQP